MPATTVAIVGASGLLGKHLANGFLENPNYDVTLVSRKGSDPEKLAAFTAKGAKVVYPDADSAEELAAALKGIEIVVSAVGSTALTEQIKYIEAAKAAGVKRFVPSEFGLDTTAPGIRDYFPALGYKFAVQDAVQASGLEWTYVISGFFFETSLSPQFYFDVPNGQVTIKGDPDKKFVILSLVDVGRWTAEALLSPSSKNATVYLPGEIFSYNEIVKVVEGATGKKLTVTYVSKADLDAQIAAAPNVWAAFLDLLVKAISDGQGTYWDASTSFKASPPAVPLASYAKTLV